MSYGEKNLAKLRDAIKDLPCELDESCLPYSWHLDSPKLFGVNGCHTIFVEVESYGRQRTTEGLKELLDDLSHGFVNCDDVNCERDDVCAIAKAQS